jgi:hypothetical protein
MIADALKRCSASFMEAGMNYSAQHRMNRDGVEEGPAGWR